MIGRESLSQNVMGLEYLPGEALVKSWRVEASPGLAPEVSPKG